MRPRRGSLAVSLIWGSPIAASNRSAALAYFMGSFRHDSRYSAIDMSVWLRASNDRANALNRESLYMIPLSTICFATQLKRTELSGAFLRSNQRGHSRSIGHSGDSLPQCNARAATALSTGSMVNKSSILPSETHFLAAVTRPQHPWFYRPAN